MSDLGGEYREVWPVCWTDDDGRTQNLWSLRRFTGEIEPDAEYGEPLYTTAPLDDAEYAEAEREWERRDLESRMG